VHSFRPAISGTNNAAICGLMDETEQRQSRVRELEEGCQAVSTRLDFLVERFMTLVPTAAATWIRQEFGRGIKDNAEHVEGLGVLGVKAIKDDMEHLIKELPRVCAALLRDRSSWAHHEAELPARSSVHKEFFLDRVFRDLISTAGAVLERHELLGNRGSHFYWQRVKEGWRYGMNPSIDPVEPELSDEYRKGLQQLREIRLRYATERKGLAEVRAQNLWDSV
jgi:hypothetical protein